MAGWMNHVQRAAGMLVLWAGLAAVAGCESEKQSSVASADAIGETTATPAIIASQHTASPLPANVAGADSYDAAPVARYEMPSGLIIEDLKVGDGLLVLPMSVLTFHYRFKIKDGTEMHVSALAGKPEPADNETTANQQVVNDASGPETQPVARLIPGLRDGLVGMKVGGRRRLVIPPNLAPGIAGNKNEKGEYRVPPDATLIYVIDAIDVNQPSAPSPEGAPSTPAPKR